MKRREFARLLAFAVSSRVGRSMAASASAPAPTQQIDVRRRAPLRPRLQRVSWHIAGNPELGRYSSDTQQVVDFAIWQSMDGAWQLWSCIRNTKAPGATRLFYRWEGSHLERPDWRPVGIVQVTDSAQGEWEGSLQAPHVVRAGSSWWMFYGSGGRIFLQTSRDGKRFTRWKDRAGRSWVFGEEPGDGPRERDPMVLRAYRRWYIYYTGNPNNQGVVYARTSSDLIHWTEPVVVAFGGRAGVDQSSAECPQVVFRHERFYLFRTQRYGRDAQTMVYQSADPMMFGINQDERFYVCTLPVAAPEIVKYRGQDFIAYLEPSLRGIRLDRLDWTADSD
jgi:hypothetical protein